MNEVELARIMKAKNLSVVGEIPVEEKELNMVKTLFIIIPPRNISDRTAFRNSVRFFTQSAINRGEKPDSIFRILIDFALESSGPKSRNPAAVFMSILKKEFGYCGKRETEKS
ncbi:MAG: hypothetical protein ACYS6W_01990 [Planctomycetota bacterium]|jgi:hypothetical protein